MQDDAYPKRPGGHTARSPYPPLLLVAQRAGATHYFLYQFVDEDGDSSASCIEFASDSFETPDAAYDEVTLDELHELGYWSASERLSRASPQNKDVEYGPGGSTYGRLATSWIIFWWNGPALHCYRGSMTSTSVVEKVKVTGW